MNPLRIYIDTSVLGGCFDVEFAPWSNGLMRDFRAGRLTPVLSDATAAEVGSAPEPVRDLHQEILALAGAVLPVTSEVLALVAKYEAKQILVAKFRADMQHIALATVAAVDALVSWKLQTHRSPREDSALQRRQRSIRLSGSEHPFPEGGDHV